MAEDEPTKVGERRGGDSRDINSPKPGPWNGPAIYLGEQVKSIVPPPRFFATQS